MKVDVEALLLLGRLAQGWRRRAETMDDECHSKPCVHSHGFKEATRELEQAIFVLGNPL